MPRVTQCYLAPKHARLLQLLDPIPKGRFGGASAFRQHVERQSAVLLQQIDQGLIDEVHGYYLNRPLSGKYSLYMA